MTHADKTWKWTTDTIGTLDSLREQLRADLLAARTLRDKIEIKRTIDSLDRGRAWVVRIFGKGEP